MDGERGRALLNYQHNRWMGTDFRRTTEFRFGRFPFSEKNRSKPSVMKWFTTFCLCGFPMMALSQTHEEKAVAAVLMAEAWSEGLRGMTAVAEVIHQRSVEKSQTPLQVVSVHAGRIHAFSSLNGTTLDELIKRFSEEPDFEQALKLARFVCGAPSRLPGITLRANHFTRATERPAWAKGHRPVAVIGRHAFYRLKYY